MSFLFGATVVCAAAVCGLVVAVCRDSARRIREQREEWSCVVILCEGAALRTLEIVCLNCFEEAIFLSAHMVLITAAAT